MDSQQAGGAMRNDAAFVVTYWGASGTLTTPLRPSQVTEKIVRVIQEINDRGAWKELEDADTDTVLSYLRRNLPDWTYSTYGGNTTCVEIQTPNSLIVFDAGSGFRELGLEIERRWSEPGYAGPRVGHVLISHAHMDHTYATPFVAPYYNPRNEFHIWGTKTTLDSLHTLLRPGAEMQGVFFPPSYDFMAGIKEFHAIEPGEPFQIDDTRIDTYPLNHPGGCCGYRLSRCGRSIVLATDHEHTEVPDRGLAEFARGADLLYLDGQYLDDEYCGRVGIMGAPAESRKGWGHSTVEACVATGLAAGVHRLHIGHREPQRDDADMSRIECLAQKLAEDLAQGTGQSTNACEVSLAREGQIVCIQI